MARSLLGTFPYDEDQHCLCITNIMLGRVESTKVNHSNENENILLVAKPIDDDIDDDYADIDDN